MMKGIHVSIKGDYEAIATIPPRTPFFCYGGELAGEGYHEKR